jgi:predicted acetyltransferase
MSMHVAHAALAAEEHLALEEPSLLHEEDYYAMLADYRAAGEVYDRGPTRTAYLNSLTQYLRIVRNESQGIGLRPGYVPVTTYWLVRGGKHIVATSSLRHELTEALSHEGGHIGYSVRPMERGKGYGTMVCALTLEECRRRGIREVLITCNTENRASARIIEKNGGVLENEVISLHTGLRVSRYWVAL